MSWQKDDGGMNWERAPCDCTDCATERRASLRCALDSPHISLIGELTVLAAVCTDAAQLSEVHQLAEKLGAKAGLGREIRSGFRFVADAIATRLPKKKARHHRLEELNEGFKRR